jgi:plasmid stabilization system protein ParE
MTLDVRLRPEAELDLADAALWYEEQYPELGCRFLDEIVAVFSTIAETPAFFPIVHRNTGRVLVHRFPFCVYYRIEPGTVVVLAVIHCSRHPLAWKIRT